MERHQAFYWGEKTINDFHMKVKSFFVWIVLPLLLINIAFVVVIGHLFFDEKLIVFKNFTFGENGIVSVWSHFPGFFWKTNLVEQKNLFYEYLQWSFVFLCDVGKYTIFPTLFCGYSIMKWLNRKSKDLVDDKFIRGSKLMEKKAYIEASKKQGAGNYAIQGIPVPSNAETSHFIIAGASGRGKTQLLKPIITAAQRGYKALINDIKGDWTQEYFRSDFDLIFNPMDKRSVKWTIFNDIDDVLDIKNFAAWIVPDLPGKDPFWQDSARMIVESCFLKMFEESTTSNEELKRLTMLKSEDLATELEGYGRGAELARKKDSFMTFQTRMTFIDFLEDGDFSIKAWIKDAHKGHIYLLNDPNTTEILKPVLTLFINALSNNILALDDDLERRIYLFLDEFTALNKLEKVIELMKLGRSKGASVWLAFQDFQQIEKIYSQYDKDTILNNSANVVILGMNEPKSAKVWSDKLGKEEFWETSKTIGMGVADNKDGLSLQQQRKERSIVTDAELMNLPRLQGYLKLDSVPGVVKIDVEIYSNQNKRNNPRLLKRELSKKEQIALAKKLQESIEFNIPADPTME